MRISDWSSDVCSSDLEEAVRLQLLEADRAAIEASGDPALKFAVQVMPALLRFEDEDEARSGRISALRPQFMQAMIDFNASQDKPVYPDANSSLRITFGTVRGYSPRDAVQMLPFTTLAGIVEKDTGVEPFDAPKAQRSEAHTSELQSLMRISYA